MKVFISHFISRLEKDDKDVAEWCHDTICNLPICNGYVVLKYVCKLGMYTTPAALTKG